MYVCVSWFTKRNANGYRCATASSRCWRVVVFRIQCAWVAAEAGRCRENALELCSSLLDNERVSSSNRSKAIITRTRARRVRRDREFTGVMRGGRAKVRCDGDGWSCGWASKLLDANATNGRTYFKC